MWISRKLYCQLVAEKAQLATRLEERDRQIQWLREITSGLTDERNALLDDVRKLIGLKRIQTPAPDAQPSPTTGPSDGSKNKQFKLKETPRNALSRLQVEFNRQAEAEDQLEIRAAIAAFEGVLK